jgi:hypothetical protein
LAERVVGALLEIRDVRDRRINDRGRWKRTGNNASGVGMSKRARQVVDLRRENQRHAIDYLVTMTRELTSIAERAGLDTAGHFLRLAEQEMNRCAKEFEKNNISIC